MCFFTLGAITIQCVYQGSAITTISPPDYVSSVHSCPVEHTVMGVLINTSLPEEQLVSLNYVLIRIFSQAHVLFISILHVQ